MTNVASLDTKGRIWRFTTPQDDDQGGAVPSGTVLYDPVFSRIRAMKPTMALLEQGLETPTIYTAMLSYVPYSATGSYNVQHNDQYEVTSPPISPYYREKFVIIGVQHVSQMDQRRYLQVTLRRFETAHPNDLQ